MEAAPRLRSWHSNIPIRFPSHAELAAVRPRQPEDVLLGAARLATQHEPIRGVTTHSSEGSHVNYDDDDPSKTRPLHQGEKLAALGIPAHFSYNLPVVTAAQPGHTAAGCAWAPSQAALVMIPLCDAWRACGGPFYPPESARRWAAL